MQFFINWAYIIIKKGVIKANINEDKLRCLIIKLALLQHKKLYEHGKHGQNTFDCAGLVWYVYNEICHLNLYDKGFGLSTTTKIMTSKYGKLTLFAENNINKNLRIIKNGDIVFFHRQSLKDNMPTENNKYPGHCGIYLGEQKFIHASSSKQKIIISDFSKNEYWLRVLVGSKNVFYNFEHKDLTSEKKAIFKRYYKK